ncbi:MAG TPA: DUF4136 domain-containing protein [Moraxellaceae bacterium]
MTLSFRGILLLPLTLLLAACGAQVVVEQDPAAHLPGPGTYAWGSASDHMPGEDNPRINNDIIAGMVQTALDTGLAKRGYKPAEKGQAAWLVHYHAGLEKQTQLVTEPMYPAAPRVVCGPYACGGGYGWGYYGPPEAVTRTVTFHEGTLILDIHDATTNKLVWRGTVSDDVNVNKPVNPARLQQAIDKLLQKLPATADAKK